jgi:Glycosyltransferase family 25 (LPS biosynthesis protein)
MTEPWVYIIHLKKRKDRFIQFKNAWKKNNLPTEKLYWFSAYEGSKITVPGFKTQARTLKRKQGRCGCYASHLGAIKRAIEKNHFPLLILEDDAIPKLTMDYAHLFADTPANAKLLYFGALPVKEKKRYHLCQTRKSGWNLGDSNVQLYGGHAYGFKTKSDAEEVLEFLQKTKITFDSALIKYRKIHPSETYIFCPFQFYQSEGYSNIEDEQRPIR